MEPFQQKAPEQQLRGRSDNTSKQRDFTGTDGPRHPRVAMVLQQHPMARQALDGTAGAVNSPELVAELRGRGLDMPCERIRFIDRGHVWRWLAKREGVAV